MQELRTWTVDNAAIAISDQRGVEVQMKDELLSRMNSAISDGELQTIDGRVTPDAVNAWLESVRLPIRWIVEPSQKYRDRTAEGERIS